MTPRKPDIDRSQPDWYKDAVIYQVHVKTYLDASGDGVGDFEGLTQRLDHIRDLGVTAIWLMPFYPSPLRDDGYDISSYTQVNPAYGTLPDFRRFVREAHRRGLRVITELVINHTSDQHPWFQKARRAKRGSAARDFYVWSDDNTKFPETRIIFTDTETSNWTWDPVAGQYFWHRFYSHQPDLNFDNPRVLAEVLRVMHFWLDMGVDGLRLDAIPYLVEREGTNNENLPETHAVLKKIRAELDAHYPDRMLLAEANQWPEDTRPYFGDGDECHMGFHFPLMPRMYMAVAQEDRYPITDILRQTPDIPDNCQWAIFLRNHDELTLEMVTDSERDYLWNTYAADRRARINLGIRRRLAPLMQNDRRKIELMNSLLLSMPGTPILYYGDEIGMGDNYYLGDRDGVRTPMQWSIDRNGGFSRADPQRLFLPVIQDPLYGYLSVNVEAQEGDASSLLNWMRRMVNVRQAHRAFGRGSMTLLRPGNRRVLAYVRETEDEVILCVANLARSAQAAEIDLSPWRGRVPVEMTGNAAFPPVGELPYLVTLPAYGFYWFRLADEAEAPRWHVPAAQVLPEFLTLTMRGGRLAEATSGRSQRDFLGEVLPKFLPLQRWFPHKGGTIGQIRMRELGELVPGRHALAVLDVAFADGAQQYFLPLSSLWGDEQIRPGAPKLSWTLAKLRQGPKVGALIDAAADEAFAAAMLDALAGDRQLDGPAGRIAFTGAERLREMEAGPPRLLTAEQSNATIAFGDEAVIKLYRRLRPGIHPDVEVVRHLTQAGFAHTPAWLGQAEWHPAEGEPVMLAAAFAFVPNQGDAWGHLSDALDRMLEEAALAPEAEAGEIPATGALMVDLCATLGRRTADLHVALAGETADAAFAPEPVSAADLGHWADEAAADLSRALHALAARRAGLGDEAQALAGRVLDARAEIAARLDTVRGLTPSGQKTRIHGDYHLGQTLVVKGDVSIIDFEGEPGRDLAARRAKTSGLRDVAGMLRSIDYAARSARIRRIEGGADPDATRRDIDRWRDAAIAAFLAAYREGMAGCPALPKPQLFEALLDLFIVQKAAYEVSYELSSRPAWVSLPLEALSAMTGRRTRR